MSPACCSKPSYDQFKQVDPFAPGPLIGPYSEVGKDIQKSMEGVLLGDADPASTLHEGAVRRHRLR